jgi:hypothetical protein
MTIAKQLFELQEIDLQMESREKAVWQMTAELGGSDALRNARSKAAEEKARLRSSGHWIGRSMISVQS